MSLRNRRMRLTHSISASDSAGRMKVRKFGHKPWDSGT